MRFEPLAVDGAYLVSLEPIEDDRGIFARTYCEREFAENGLPSRMVQSSLSWSKRRGTVRGMHFQKAPSAEGKLVRCTRGRIYDAIIDLRPQSSTYTLHVAVELDAEGRRALYVPPGCAHGFQTLTDATEVLYLMSDFFDPELSAGVRWNDPAFGVAWPLKDVILAPRDASYPDFDPVRFAQSHGSAL